MRKNIILEIGLPKNGVRPVLSRVGFTLVELIVVITILAILGTIAIMAFSGYSKNARDSARVSDISRMVSSVELFQVAKGFFPEPTNGIPVTYSGATAWIQGTFGDNTVTNVEKINKKPVDPLTGSEYTYSITNAKKEFQLGAIYEGDSIASVVNQTYAAEAGKALVKGNYNGSILKVSTGSVDYILAIPSILASDIETSPDVVSIVGNDRLVFDKYSNLPASYKGTSYEVSGSFGYTRTEPELVVFSGSVLDLNDKAKQLTFFKNLQDAYVGTVVSNEPEIKNILAYDTTANEEGSLFTAQVLLNENVTNSVKLTATNQNNAGGNTGGGGGQGAGSINAGSFNYSFFSGGLIPQSTSTPENPQYIDDNRNWTPVEIEPGKVMILDNNEVTDFGFFSVASNGQITHLFSKKLQDAINIPSDWRSFNNNYYQFDNVLHLGGGKFVVISKNIYTDGSNGYPEEGTRYHLFSIDMNTQILTYYNTYELRPLQDPTHIDGWSTYLGAFVDDNGNIRVAYTKIISKEPNSGMNSYEIWMQKVSTAGNTFTVTEDQKIFDMTNGSAFGFAPTDYAYLNSIAFEKVSGNKGILFTNVRIYDAGVDGYREPYAGSDDIKRKHNAVYALGVNFSSATYSTGSVHLVVDDTLGSDWPFFTLPVGGDRVVMTSVGYRSVPDDEEPYIVVAKINQSTLEITSGSPALLGGDETEGYYFMGIEKINDNKIIIAGETNPKYNYGDPIPLGILPAYAWWNYAVDNISEVVYPVDGSYSFVYETSTNKSYRIDQPDRNSITEITNFEDVSNPANSGIRRFGGGSFWEVDLGVGNLTPINVTETFGGHFGKFTDGVKYLFELDDARMLRLSNGQIYMGSSFNRVDGVYKAGQYTRVDYPHIILTPQ